MIVLIAGLPGSGKSFFAERLAGRMNACHLNIDAIRQEMRARGSYSFQDKLIVYNEMLKRTALLAFQNKDVVVDATFYHHTMREMFISWAKEQSVRVAIIEVVADEKLVNERVGKPRKFSEADYAVYEKVRDEFEEITMPHLILESTDENIEKMLEKAGKFLRHSSI
ncbi:MAG TPA: AAA family ATPase [Cyclobacteriaceae bacterium]|nr:AAA family ATPase [Cyclobacteriaceae bacterium]